MRPEIGTHRRLLDALGPAGQVGVGVVAGVVHEREEHQPRHGAARRSCRPDSHASPSRRSTSLEVVDCYPKAVPAVSDSVRAARSPARGDGGPAPSAERSHAFPAGWPLILALGGYAAVWAAGGRLFVWPLVDAYLAWWMFKHHTPLRAPRGFGIWLCFIAWSLLSVLVIEAPDRLVAWGYRESLYLSAAVILVFGVSVGRRHLPTRWIGLAIIWLFGSSVVLACVGLVVPDLTIPTLAELVLPRPLLSSQFVAEQVLGRVSATAVFLDAVRPVAPYGYTNEWGAAMGMLWPLTVYSLQWLRHPLSRALVVCLLALAVVPAVLSVNRGLWVSAMVAAAVVLFRSLTAGRVRLLIITMGMTVVVAAAVWLSPLRDALLGRVARPNLGTRQTLVADAFDLVAQSPWFGLGAPQTALFSNDTNDVSVGTHGQFFTLLVSHGYPGVISTTGSSSPCSW